MKALDKKIETLRALLGQDKDSQLGLSKPNSSIEERVEPHFQSNKSENNSFNAVTEQPIDTNIEEVIEQTKALPKATKTFTPRDFLHFKKHSNEQSLVLIKRFLSKHGKPEENSSELHALTSAISRIIEKSIDNKLKK